jgi:hypothetical protein
MDASGQTGALLVSELVTDAIRHGTGDVTVSVDCTDSWLVVGVSDESTDTPIIDHSPATDQLAGPV